RFKLFMRLTSERTAGSHSSCSSSAWRRTSPSSFWRGSISAGNHGAEIGEGAFAPERRGRRPLAVGSHGKSGEGHLELSVVGLDGGDLLHQKTRPEEHPERALLRKTREQALELESDRGDQGQERQLQEEEEHVVAEAAEPEVRQEG